jgi:hypothetical protein
MLVDSDAEDVEDYSDYSEDGHDGYHAHQVVDVRDVTQTIGGLCEVLKSKAVDPSMKAHVEDFQQKITWLLEMLEAQRPQRPMPLRLRWLREIEPCVDVA